MCRSSLHQFILIGVLANVKKKNLTYKEIVHNNGNNDVTGTQLSINTIFFFYKYELHAKQKLQQVQLPI